MVRRAARCLQSNVVVYENRVDAGRQLAGHLERFRGQNAVVLGLARGGVPVAAEIARALELPLDVLIVRKLGVPFHPEVAMGAIAEGGVRVLDEQLVASIGTSAAQVAEVEDRERRTLEARTTRLRQGRTPLELTGRIAIIVDDGVATGATARAACQLARRLGAARVVLAVPVGPADTLGRFPEADEVVCPAMLDLFWAVGSHYRDFSQSTDEEVSALLEAGRPD